MSKSHLFCYNISHNSINQILTAKITICSKMIITLRITNEYNYANIQ